MYSQSRGVKSDDPPLLPSPTGEEATLEMPPAVGYQFRILQELGIWRDRSRFDSELGAGARMHLASSQREWVTPLMYSDLEFPSMAKEFTGKVCLVESPTRIWVLPLDLKDEFFRMKKIIDVYSPEGKPSYSKENPPVKNQIALMSFEEDDRSCWYRVWVKRVDNLNCTARVDLVDYGESRDDVPWMELKYAPRDLSDIKVCAVRVCSAGAGNFPAQLDLSEIVWQQLDALLDQTVTVKVLGNWKCQHTGRVVYTGQILSGDQDVSAKLRACLIRTRRDYGDDSSLA